MRRRYLPLLAAAMVLPHAAHAQEARQPVPRIVVVGEGEAAVAPDLAIVTLSVLRESDTARAALDEANKAAAEVIAAMKEAGIEARDLQTGGLQINPRYVYPQNGGEEQPRIVAYQVTNTLTVRVRDIAKVGEIVDRSVTLGVNQGGSIAFTNDDPSAARAEARRLAVNDAIARARTLAEAAGVGLGPIIEMSEQSHAQPPMPMVASRAYRMEAQSDAVPVEAGENVYRVQINATFELKQ
ncbi:MAG TPA: SIMPL domain-containing protein [Aquamicrobium sp.]|nr:SIMPL domain-containing protein [Aquamicrobium sp.]